MFFNPNNKKAPSSHKSIYQYEKWHQPLTPIKYLFVLAKQQDEWKWDILMFVHALLSNIHDKNTGLSQKFQRIFDCLFVVLQLTKIGRAKQSSIWNLTKFRNPISKRHFVSLQACSKSLSFGIPIGEDRLQ
jgi:hypothetical protein